MKVKYDDNPQILNNFLNYLLVVRNYSETTVKSYNLDIIIFFKFIKDYFDIQLDVKDFNIFTLANIKESDIIAFLIYLNFNRDNTANTRDRKLASIKCFFKWLFKTNPSMFYSKVHPAKEIPKTQKVMRLPKHLNLKNAKKMQSIFNVTNSKFAIRNNTIITLFLDTAIRISELVNIDLVDINFKERKINIERGKGGKQRTVYFSEHTKQQLLKYLKIRNRNKKVVNINEALFLSLRDKKMGVRAVQEICKNAFKLAGLENYNYTSHSLRHTVATLLYQYGQIDIRTIQVVLGHSSIKSTEIYTHTYSEVAKKAMDRHPLNNYHKNEIEIA